ncbi:MAG: amino acid ABC transporter substrate-binding protein, partial [Deltaproteobacteria bacterium]|nr:amino acid ABC transporter substrate-binding protein [Deltaproteobacteria bacterium]
MKMWKSLFIGCTLVMATASLCAAENGDTLKSIKDRGYIQVGVNGDLFGFGKADQKGIWKGLDVDTASAVAVAVFGDLNERLRFTPLTAKTRFTALQSK